MTAPKAVRHLTTEQLAERLNVSKRALENWRRDGRGPAYIKDGGLLLYRLKDVEAWEESRLVTTAA